MREPEEFDYLNSNLSQPFNQTIRMRSEEMFEREIRERARMLYNLRFSREEATLRLRQNFAWEFDDAWALKAPEAAYRIEKIVEAVYAHVEGKSD